MSPSETLIDPSAPFDAPSGIAFRARMALLDQAVANRQRYAAYAMKCHDQAISINAGKADATSDTFVPGVSGWPTIPHINAGKADATSDTFVPGVSGWPTIPHEVAVADVGGWKYVEPGEDGPRTLDEVDPVNFHVIPVPEDHHLSQIEKQAALPKGVIDVGTLEAGVIYRVGPNDTWPAGIETPPDANGHTYLKFSWAGFGYKYQLVK